MSEEHKQEDDEKEEEAENKIEESTRAMESRILTI